MYQYFYENFKSEKLPNHVIYLCKQDLLNIKEMQFHKLKIKEFNLDSYLIDLSKLESIGIKTANLLSLLVKNLI